jgi:hypothetical protein
VGFRDGLPEGLWNTAKGLFYYEGKMVPLSYTPILLVDMLFLIVSLIWASLDDYQPGWKVICYSHQVMNVKPDQVMASLAGKGFGIS